MTTGDRLRLDHGHAPLVEASPLLKALDSLPELLIELNQLIPLLGHGLEMHVLNIVDAPLYLLELPQIEHALPTHSLDVSLQPDDALCLNLLE